jgi:hypothetical protein
MIEAPAAAAATPTWIGRFEDAAAEQQLAARGGLVGVCAGISIENRDHVSGMTIGTFWSRAIYRACFDHCD